MSELEPFGQSLPEQTPVARWRPVVQFFNRTLGRGETLEEFEAARIAEVRAETAQVPGVVGRLGRLVDGLVMAPPEGVTVVATPYRSEIKRVFHPVEVTIPIVGNTVTVKRLTDYNYDPIYGSVPPGNDWITVTVTPRSSAEPSMGRAMATTDSADLREIGMRVNPSGIPGKWVVSGMHQLGDWDGHPGTQYEWQALTEVAANAFMDRVFGPEQSVQPELPQ